MRSRARRATGTCILAVRPMTAAPVLASLTTPADVGIAANMKAVLLARRRIVHAEDAFAALVLWRLPSSAPGSEHVFKYRLAYVVAGACVVHCDNEVGKGDHRHYGRREATYDFTTLDALVADFERDIQRWNRENRRP
jgi:hypothetical protein